MAGAPIIPQVSSRSANLGYRRAASVPIMGVPERPLLISRSSRGPTSFTAALTNSTGIVLFNRMELPPTFSEPLIQASRRDMQIEITSAQPFQDPLERTRPFSLARGKEPAAGIMVLGALLPFQPWRGGMVIFPTS